MPEKIMSIESNELGTLYFMSGDYNIIKSEKASIEGDDLIPIDQDGGEKAVAKFESSLKTVKEVALKIVENIRSIEMMPDELECKIGVTFDTEVGVIFAKVGTECNLELTLKWIKEKSGSPQAKVKKAD